MKICKTKVDRHEESVREVNRVNEEAVLRSAVRNVTSWYHVHKKIENIVLQAKMLCCARLVC